MADQVVVHGRVVYPAQPPPCPYDCDGAVVPPPLELGSGLLAHLAFLELGGGVQHGDKRQSLRERCRRRLDLAHPTLDAVLTEQPASAMNTTLSLSCSVIPANPGW
jgi:hypothetical protein